MKIKNTKKAVKYSLIAISIALLGFAIIILYDARKIGEEAGTELGTIIGGFIGSYDGITEGIEAGINAGLQAENTEVDMNSIEELGELEVLEINFIEYDVEQIGGKKLNRLVEKEENTGVLESLFQSLFSKKNEDTEEVQAENSSDIIINPDYALLYSIEGKAIYSVDLREVNIELDNKENTLNVDIPEVICKISYDETKVQNIAEYQKSSNTGKTIEGVIAYQNSKKEIKKKIEELYKKGNGLKSAEESAKRQVKELIEIITGISVSKITIKGAENE